MKKLKKKQNGNGANLGFEEKLWAAADPCLPTGRDRSPADSIASRRAPLSNRFAERRRRIPTRTQNDLLVVVYNLFYI